MASFLKSNNYLNSLDIVFRENLNTILWLHSQNYSFSFNFKNGKHRYIGSRDRISDLYKNLETSNKSQRFYKLLYYIHTGQNIPLAYTLEH